MDKLTKRQQQILELIRTEIGQRGMPPTRAEIATRLGFRSANAAEQHLRALARKGHIQLVAGTSRGIRLTAAADREGLPLVGRVAAGAPLLAQEHIENHYHLAPELFTSPPEYLLRVRGMSMRDAGILDGDLLAVSRTLKPGDGRIVVARIGDEVTVKRLELDGDRVRLLAENPDFKPIAVDPRRDALTIEGVVVGVIRTGPL
ncbi:MAG: transcriptional repressor LexA [Candidatus Competibacteraceae bacterium]|nr:transcriptional repressor LexA [Candidatus Competibacteraceae bacterium]